MNRHISFAVWALLSVLASSHCDCFAEPDGWTKSIVSEKVRPKKKYFYNSQHLATSNGRSLHVGYVETIDNVDHLMHARQTTNRWVADVAMKLPHSGKPMSGIDGFALGLGPRNQAQFYVYSKDYEQPGPTFREHWAAQSRRGWQVETIRESVKKLGGAGLSGPMIAIDRKGLFHVSAYVHNGFGTYHRVRHRYFDGRSFLIDAVPRTSGRKDSGVGAIAIDSKDTIHFVYETKRALNRSTNAHPDYPDSALAYATFDRGRWSSPTMLRGRVSPDPNEQNPESTKYQVLSMGLKLDGKQTHVVYAISTRKRAVPTFLIYGLYDGKQFRETLVTQFIPKRYSHGTAIFGPEVDDKGNVHFAFDTDVDSRHAVVRKGQPTIEKLPGDLGGFVLDERGHPVLLTRDESELAVYWKP